MGGVLPPIEFRPYGIDSLLPRGAINYKKSLPKGGTMKIEVIEPIGKVRKAIFGNVLEALKECGINGKVEVVRDLGTIIKYGVKAAPALVINGVVMFAGTSLPTEEIIKILQQNLSTFS